MALCNLVYVWATSSAGGRLAKANKANQQPKPQRRARADDDRAGNFQRGTASGDGDGLHVSKAYRAFSHRSSRLTLGVAAEDFTNPVDRDRVGLAGAAADRGRAQQGVVDCFFGRLEGGLEQR